MKKSEIIALVSVYTGLGGLALYSYSPAPPSTIISSVGSSSHGFSGNGHNEHITRGGFGKTASYHGMGFGG